MCKPFHTLLVCKELYGSQRLEFWNTEHEVWKHLTKTAQQGSQCPGPTERRRGSITSAETCSVSFVENFSAFCTKKKKAESISVFWTLALKLILPRNYWRPWWEWGVNWTFTFLPIMLFYCSDCGEEVGFVYQVELEVSGQGPGETKQPQDRTGTRHTGAIPEGCQSPFWL